MSDGLDDADKAALKGIAARREGTEVAFYEPARLLSKEALGAIDATLEGVHWLTAATYYRILAADLLPADAHRALYLDGDVVCAGSLSELFAADLRGCPAGMCLDLPHLQIFTYNRLGYPPAEGYFNSGVVLLDLDAWRRENLARAMLDYLVANAKRLKMQDQDLICAVLHGRILQLDYSYNVTGPCLYVHYWLQEEKNGYYAFKTQSLPKSEWPALLDAVEAPRLVHVAPCIKPWYNESDWPFACLWRYFYAQSPWANEPLQYKHPRTARTRIKRLGRKALEALHLIAPQQPAGIPYPQEAYKSARRMLDELMKEDASAGK